MIHMVLMKSSVICVIADVVDGNLINEGDYIEVNLFTWIVE